ncbi:hypothetical protein FB451DRAFT_1194989 [Mycena latifolia]|nr:hypothetical protein FB451DRAFT_1194989 [Mycena latifolia]
MSARHAAPQDRAAQRLRQHQPNERRAHMQPASAAPARHDATMQQRPNENKRSDEDSTNEGKEEEPWEEKTNAPLVISNTADVLAVAGILYHTTTLPISRRFHIWSRRACLRSSEGESPRKRPFLPGRENHQHQHKYTNTPQDAGCRDDGDSRNSGQAHSRVGRVVPVPQRMCDSVRADQHSALVSVNNPRVGLGWVAQEAPIVGARVAPKKRAPEAAI